MKADDSNFNQHLKNLGVLTALGMGEVLVREKTMKPSERLKQILDEIRVKNMFRGPQEDVDTLCLALCQYLDEEYEKNSKTSSATDRPLDVGPDQCQKT